MFLKFFLKSTLKTINHNLESLSVELGYGEPTHRDKQLKELRQRLINEKAAIKLLLNL